jgi:hypothetical protein
MCQTSLQLYSCIQVAVIPQINPGWNRALGISLTAQHSTLAHRPQHTVCDVLCCAVMCTVLCCALTVLCCGCVPCCVCVLRCGG